ncbi:MAG TPA: PilZ domain-containing protein [Anaeromyxobacteraceae bacterium]|jgi:hypothetical protein
MQPRIRTSRSAPRFHRRVRVTLLQSTSFTLDVGAGGFGVERVRVPPPGSAVEGVIALRDRVFPFLGRVAWARPGDVTLGLRGRMGVHFTHISRDFAERVGDQCLPGTGLRTWPAGPAPLPAPPGRPGREPGGPWAAPSGC